MKCSVSTALFLAVSLVLCACSAPSADSLAQNDPWEKTNRDIFDFDVWVEHNVAAPVDDGYRALVPAPGREGVHNVVSNLHEPIVLANDVLQGDGKKALHTLGRILINSTLGLGGLIDVATKVGIPHHDNDFGVTLGQNGVAEGSYLVLPFLGPKPPRDLLGSGVDGAFDPLNYARFPGRHILLLSRSPLVTLDTVDRQRDDFEAIERTSLDFYATARNLYRQQRNALIRGEGGTQLWLPDL